ncbi:MAG: ATP-binding protein [Clostridia bacterium]|nr:ATP-binding protein [Clostridia bacterium]
MKELSLNILDVAENSVKAGATLIRIELKETAEELCLTIADNGCGMTPEVVKGVIDPFYTTRTTRKVGLGIPLLKLAAEQTGGKISICSRHVSQDAENPGTTVTAYFFKNHIDFTPLGDVVSTVTTLIQGSPQIDFVFLHETESCCVSLDTREMRTILGDDVGLNEPDILRWIAGYLQEQYEQNK